MTESRFQVFVSSTYNDLIEERDAVIRGLLAVDCFPSGMELFAASDESQWEMIKSEIDQSDYFIVLSAGKYGSINPDSGYSYTETEYRYALERKKPIAAFLRSDLKRLEQDKCEIDPKARKSLEDFHALMTAHKVASFWKSTDELKNLVTLSILRLKKVRPTIGWVRADQVSSKAILEELIEHQNKIQSLQQIIAEYQRHEGQIDSRYAWGDDTFEVLGFLQGSDDAGLTHQWTMRTTWKLLFDVLGADLETATKAGKTRGELSNTLAKLMVRSAESMLDETGKPTFKTTDAEASIQPKDAAERAEDAHIFSNCFQTILSQCQVHGLIELGAPGKYRLTTFGRRHLRELCAVPKDADKNDLPDLEGEERI